MDSEGLRSLGIATIGQRLLILKAIYLVKLAQNITFNEDDYIPLCLSNPSHEYSYLRTKVISAEAPERVDEISLEKLHSVIKDQGEILLF